MYRARHKARQVPQFGGAVIVLELIAALVLIAKMVRNL